MKDRAGREGPRPQDREFNTEAQYKCCEFKDSFSFMVPGQPEP